ncbi:MAG: hypothetical protein M0P71_01010 [Melioribacteraceae bacterium]|nr:hypothetical protein [Melioribacteraceae bacterium]
MALSGRTINELEIEIEIKSEIKILKETVKRLEERIKRLEKLEKTKIDDRFTNKWNELVDSNHPKIRY